MTTSAAPVPVHVLVVRNENEGIEVNSQPVKLFIDPNLSVDEFETKMISKLAPQYTWNLYLPHTTYAASSQGAQQLLDALNDERKVTIQDIGLNLSEDITYLPKPVLSVLRIKATSRTAANASKPLIAFGAAPLTVSKVSDEPMGRDELFKHGMEEGPSTMSQPVHYVRVQNSKNAFLDGRYHDNVPESAIPVPIYHRAFATFLGALLDPNPPTKQFRLDAAKLMKHTSRISTNEEHRQVETRSLLQEILGMAVGKSINADKTNADHTMLYGCRGDLVGEALLCCFEEKGELGHSGAGDVQAQFSYLRFWADRQRTKLRNGCACPSFLVSVSGSWLAVSGVVATDRVIVNHLNGYSWLGMDRFDRASILAVARVVRALKLGLEDLRNYYQDIKPIPGDALSFPSPNTYPGPNGRVKFAYVRRLKEDSPKCQVFQVRTEQQELRVVKFVETYGANAHQLLAAHNCAPALLYHGPIWADDSEDNLAASYVEWQMVVMPYVEKAVTLDTHKSAAGDEAFGQLLRQAVQILHDANMVHGDLRAPNILVCGTSEEPLPLIIDFDWAGKSEEVTYPHDLNMAHNWHPGVKQEGSIKAEHDMHMVEQVLD